MIEKNFKIGDKIRNLKTKKEGIVVDNNYDNKKILKYHLIGTPNNIHTELNPEERFEIIEHNNLYNKYINKYNVVIFILILIFSSLFMFSLFIFSNNKQNTENITIQNIENVKIQNNENHNTNYIDKLVKIKYNDDFIDLKDINKPLEYMLPSNDVLILEFEDKNNNISMIELDNVKMELVNNIYLNNTIKQVQTNYEILPQKTKLKIYFKDNTFAIFDINIKYKFKFKIKDFNKNWIFSNLEKVILNHNENLILEKFNNLVMEYGKNFDKDFNLDIDFIILNEENIDFKISTGNRIYFYFNNDKIEVYLKEKKENFNDYVKYDFINKNIKFKKNEIYNLKLNVEKNKYTLEIKEKNNILNNKKSVFIDKNNNPIEVEQYKDLKLSFNNMDIKITNIEIN